MAKSQESSTCLEHSCVPLGLLHTLKFWITFSFPSPMSKGLQDLNAVLYNCAIRTVPLSLSMGTVSRWKGCTGIQILTKDIPDHVWGWRDEHNTPQ